MKRTVRSLGILLFAAALAYAETWGGRLLDANCATRQTTAEYAPTSSTTAFAVGVNGKILKFDSKGNKKAAEAFKSYNSGLSGQKNQIPNTPK
jgi:hypothetical protein